ncbi:MAG: PAS domain-containing protein [Deltaproteobacteria bacterium]|nr:PAS domain-containing protein [Deltaproteobacteria bacterium]
MNKPREEKDRPETVARLRRRLEEQEAIIQGISDSLLLLEARTYEILEVNQAFLDSYGLSRNEVLGKKCYEITHQLKAPCHQEPGHGPCPLAETVASGKPANVEHAHSGPDGKILYFEITTYPLKEPNGTVVRVVHLSRDITLRKNLELEEREKEKLSGILELAGGASHEINQPLTVIISGLEQLVKRLPRGGLEQDIALTVLENVKRLEKISEKLARITRYASKDYAAGKRIFDLDQGA